MQPNGNNGIIKCPLCKGTKHKLISKQCFDCDECGGIFKDPQNHPSPKAEKARYIKHNNDINDPNYQQFVSPITNAVLNDFSANDSGLDFGAGPGPVITKLLEDQNYKIAKYDPYFHDHPQLLDRTYDYIICCEVIEHFYNPAKEFKLLRNLLKPNGKLYCMTYLYENSVSFSNWYYKNDSTHVFFYRKQTINWIKKKHHFANAIIKDRLIVFS